MSSLPPASVLGTEVREMESSLTGKRYRISIALPYTYIEDHRDEDFFDRPSPSGWPVVYLMDANWYFGMVTDIVRSSSWYGRTRDAIVVGVGYPDSGSLQQTFRDVMVWRLDDLTPARPEPAKLDGGHSGGQGRADRFLTFLKEDLIPLVDREYRTDPSRRILAGHSRGGLFTTYALFEEPDLFRSYIAGSPVLDRADRVMFQLEEAFSQTHGKLAAQLYLGVGDLEEDAEDTTVSDVYRFAAQLEGRKLEGLSVTKQVFPDSNHCEVIAPAFQAGLRLALAK